MNKSTGKEPSYMGGTETVAGADTSRQTSPAAAPHHEQPSTRRVPNHDEKGGISARESGDSSKEIFNDFEQPDQTRAPCVSRESFTGSTVTHDKPGVSVEPNHAYGLLQKDEANVEDNFPAITPVTVRFKDLTMSVTTEKPGLLRHAISLCKRRKLAPLKKKMILDLGGIEESFGPGDFVALMGSSGAGKSTMLNVLSCRVTANVKGSIHLNEYEASPLVCKQLSCFVQQLDVFYAHLTVSEHLRYQARLRLSPRTTAAERREVYEGLIRKMGLWKVKDSFIGDASTHGSISGGEQKRLAVATELLNQPSIIFADEPTSGLDSFMAKAVCAQLARLAATNRTVVCTIHQPSSTCFELFNKVCLIAQGRVMFCGPRLAAIRWFEQRYKECAPFTNPAEYLIECVSLGNLAEEDKQAAQDRISKWAEEWKRDGKQFVKTWEDSDDALHSNAAMGRLSKMASVVLSGSMEERMDQFPTKPAHLEPAKVDSKRKSKDYPQEAFKTAADLGCDNDCKGVIDAPPGVQQVSEVKAFEPFELLKKPIKLRVDHPFKIQAAEYKLVTEPKLNLLQEFWVLACRSTKLMLRNKNMTWFRLIVTLFTAFIPSFMYFQLSWDMSDAWNRVAAGFQVLLSQAMASVFVVVFSFPVDHPVAMRESESGAIHMWLYFLARVQTDSIIWIIFPALYHLICFWIMRLATTAIKWLVTLCVTLLVVQCLLSYGYLVAAIIPEANAALAIVQVLQIILMLFSGLMVKLDQVGRFWVWVEAISPFKYGLEAFSYELFKGELLQAEGSGPVEGEVFLEKTFGMKDKFWFDIGILFALLFGVRALAILWVFLFSRFRKENQ